MTDTYYAIFRKDGQPRPNSATYEAEDISDAIGQMCGLVGERTTNNIVEFEIMKVLENNRYVRVAMKPAKRPKGTEAVTSTDPVPPAVIDTTILPFAQPEHKYAKVEEKQYTPYRKEVA